MRASGTAAGRIAVFVAILASCAGRCACDGKPPAARTEPPTPPGAASALGACLDGQRALGHIERVIALGPRHAGTPGAERVRQLIAETLRGFGLEPRRHDFEAHTPHPDLASVPMANITVDFAAADGEGGPASRFVLIGGHFDGKLLPGIEFQGANDGGSSTGLLLELARCLAAHPPPVPVRLAWFDGEEAIVQWSDSDSLYGSKRMALDLVSSGEKRRIAAAVIVDMIGDPHLRIERERLSTPWVSAALRRAAERAGHGELMRGRESSIEDDHVPFLRIGVPAAVLIDLQYGPGWGSNEWWHTADDDLGHVSPGSMAAVGRIVVEALPDLLAGPPPPDPR